MSKPLRSPYPDAANYLAQLGYRGPVVDPSNIITWQFYLGQRVDFEKGYSIDFKTVKNHVDKLLEAPNAPSKIPFFMMSHWNWDGYGPGMVAFGQNLATLVPDQTWDIPYATLDLYCYEDYFAGPPKKEVLQLYWLTKKDFKGID